LSLSISTSTPCNHHALVRGNALLFEGVCIAHRQCLPPLCKSGRLRYRTISVSEKMIAFVAGRTSS
jgi:hypothetical protein